MSLVYGAIVDCYTNFVREFVILNCKVYVAIVDYYTNFGRTHFVILIATMFYYSVVALYPYSFDSL